MKDCVVAEGKLMFSALYEEWALYEEEFNSFALIDSLFRTFKERNEGKRVRITLNVVEAEAQKGVVV